MSICLHGLSKHRLVGPTARKASGGLGVYAGGKNLIDFGCVRLQIAGG